jgi:3-methyl-2-oxobutanoate hydroxymethyltransferase
MCTATGKNKKITVLTCYDYTTAKILAKTDIDILLVGDSLGMVKLGYENTLPVTLEDMISAAAAVRRGAPKKFIVCDMPYGTYENSPETALKNAKTLIEKTGCNAVKLEGGAQMSAQIEILTKNNISVMAHIGLLPQSVEKLGGYKVQGKTPETYKKILEDAKAVEAAGAKSVVVEGVIESLANDIAAAVSIPTIGIGAGKNCSGQVLVIDDMLGAAEPVPKFVKKYADIAKITQTAVNAYIKEVRENVFPSEENIYK